MLEVNYDKKFDVLYLGFFDKNRSYGDEEPDGFVVMRDLDTEEVTGITVLNFMKKHTQGLIPDVPFPVKFTYENDVLPIINR